MPNSSLKNSSSLLNIEHLSSGTKRKWSEEEDNQLEECVQRQGAKGWNKISSMLPGRTAKQCRERWHHKVNPNIKKGDWNPQEDQIILMSYPIFQHSWTKMAKLLPGRTDSDVKNRYYALKRHQREENISNHSPNHHDDDEAATVDELLGMNASTSSSSSSFMNSLYSSSLLLSSSSVTTVNNSMGDYNIYPSSNNNNISDDDNENDCLPDSSKRFRHVFQNRNFPFCENTHSSEMHRTNTFFMIPPIAPHLSATTNTTTAHHLLPSIDSLIMELPDTTIKSNYDSKHDQMGGETNDSQSFSVPLFSLKPSTESCSISISQLHDHHNRNRFSASVADTIGNNNSMVVPFDRVQNRVIINNTEKISVVSNKVVSESVPVRKVLLFPLYSIALCESNG